MIQNKYNRGFILNVALIFAGALGNILDSVFYGVIFTESTMFETAKLFPEGGGYAPFLHGKVVDMLYFPLIEGNFPSWFPVWGGEEFLFFRPVFNIADSAITVGVFLILIFQKRYFKEEHKEKDNATQRDHRRLKIKRLESKSGLYFYLYYKTKPYYEKSFNLNNNTTFLLCWVSAVRTKHRNKKIKKTYLLPCG
ncbi:signal peptidase II [Sphingobacterium sp. T2]|uniref:signal peptidase II n=1 Tax=Sphingobacterium sp. T2 TaxID=1590596 RepID=UPI000A6641F3|nr:signal peptidase II [Sphingobacterium sp. T2]